MSLSFRIFFGVQGVAVGEVPAARHWGKIFKRLLILVLMALLFQHYLLERHFISIDFVFFDDWFIWGFFAVEEILLLHLVNHKKIFLLHNWLNLVIILVAFPPLLRSHDTIITLQHFRLLLLFRLMPSLWDAVVDILAHNRISTTLIVTFIVTILWGEFIPLIDPGVKNPWDGIWLAWETVTTVGFGDIVPHNFMGRMFAILLMIIGVALTSLLTANFASYIIHRTDKKNKHDESVLLEKLNALEQKVENLMNKVEKK